MSENEIRSYITNYITQNPNAKSKTIIKNLTTSIPIKKKQSILNDCCIIINDLLNKNIITSRIQNNEQILNLVEKQTNQ